MRWLALLLAIGCDRSLPPGPTPPVSDGGYLVYAVTESGPGGTEQYQLKLSFRYVSGRFEIDFASTGSGEPMPTVKTDLTLVPEDNVITNFELGRLWLPPDARREGKRTPCGMVSGPRKFQQWDVYAVDGVCATGAGIRYYEASTGMLVGFQFSGADEITAKLETSG